MQENTERIEIPEWVKLIKELEKEAEEEAKRRKKELINKLLQENSNFSSRATA